MVRRTFTEAPYSIPCPCEGCLYWCEGYMLSCEAWKEWALATQEEWRKRKWLELAMSFHTPILLDCLC